MSDDPLYEKAKNIVIANNNAQPVLLQRMLTIGYIRADRLIEALEQEGIISKPDYKGYRYVLETDK